ncbi:unnamed protein product [Protopolystoma xenopodis]|uniref:Uncharacterized protein n=1 Tax=Protopolystoma xenopodis TaxID=117903 RepID=A0A448XKA9_9PLAT|nr:unnamed protein product [Protopolystoma xenopodis]
MSLDTSFGLKFSFTRFGCRIRQSANQKSSPDSASQLAPLRVQQPTAKYWVTLSQLRPTVQFSTKRMFSSLLTDALMTSH